MKIALNPAWIFIVAMTAGAASTSHDVPGSGNAALRYWAAFSELRDLAVNAQQAKELNAILDGTVPYDDSKYQDLVKKNQLALDIMSRGTLLQKCDWGLDYDFGVDMPVEYARDALALGKLNVLYTFHLLKGGNVEGAVQALVAGLRFSHDVGNGGSLFATIVAASLLIDHLRAVTEVLRLEQLTADQNSRLQTAVVALGRGLDWSSAAKRDIELLRRDYAQSPQSSAALNRIITAYVAALSGGFNSSAVEQAIKTAPKNIANVVPNLGGLLKQRQALLDAIRQTRAVLQ